MHLYIIIGITYQIFHPLTTTCLVPILILCILNYRIIIGSKRMSASLQNDISMARIMMTIVAVFITLSIPKMVLALYEVTTIPNILECYRRSCHYYITSNRWVADSIVRYLVMLNSSTNFLIYCCFGSNFRRTLFSYFKRKQSNTNTKLVAEEVTEATNTSQGVTSSSTMQSDEIRLKTIRGGDKDKHARRLLTTAL